MFCVLKMMKKKRRRRRRKAERCCGGFGNWISSLRVQYRIDSFFWGGGLSLSWTLGYCVTPKTKTQRLFAINKKNLWDRDGKE
jgi:hypothetical protein